MQSRSTCVRFLSFNQAAQVQSLAWILCGVLSLRFSHTSGVTFRKVGAVRLLFMC